MLWICSLLAAVFVSELPHPGSELRPVLFALEEEEEEGRGPLVEPVVLFDPVEALEGIDDGETQTTVYLGRMGTTLHFTDGRGSAVLLKPAPGRTCVSALVEVRVDAAARSPTKSTLLSSETSLRERSHRALSGVEKGQLGAMLRTVARQTRAPMLSKKTSSFQVVNLGPGANAMLVGTVSTSDNPAVGDRFLLIVAQLNSKHSKVEYVNVTHLYDHYDQLGRQEVLGFVDLDADGMAELVVREHEKEGYTYVIHRRSAQGTWSVWLRSGGQGC
jgi:hypothetical protein